MDVKLNTKIRFDRRQSTQDTATGAMVESWVPYDTVWANIADVPAIRAHERIEQNLRIGERLAKITLRYRLDISTEMRATDLRTMRVMKLLAPPSTVEHLEWIEILVADFTTEGDAQ